MSADSGFGATSVGASPILDDSDQPSDDDVLKSGGGSELTDGLLTEEDVSDLDAARLAALPLDEFLRRIANAPPIVRAHMIMERESGVRRGIRMDSAQTTDPIADWPFRNRPTEAERQRYHAYGVQQAKSAYASALSGTGVPRNGLVIVDNVKDAVKFIVRRFAERVERW